MDPIEQLLNDLKGLHNALSYAESDGACKRAGELAVQIAALEVLRTTQQANKGDERAKCPACGGNDRDMPCAFPRGGQPGFHRDVRLSLAAAPQAVATMTDEQRNAIATLLTHIEDVLPDDSWDLIDENAWNDVSALLAAQASQSPDTEQRRSEADAIAQLIALHAQELDQNDYAYFELAYTRRTEWMAWICSNHRDDDPNRKVIARGQGGTPQEACAAAVAARKGASA